MGGGGGVSRVESGITVWDLTVRVVLGLGDGGGYGARRKFKLTSKKYTNELELPHVRVEW